MTIAVSTRCFEPGTLGWSADDFADAEFRRLWAEGHYEIVDGVLTIMPAAYFPSGAGLFNLLYLLKSHLKEHRLPGSFSVEVDLVLRKDRIVRSDAVMLTPDDERRQQAASRRPGKFRAAQAPILIAPTLVIESVSPDHGDHDRVTKRAWYAESGIPNYWILDAWKRSLNCLRLDGSKYRVDQAGRGKAKLQPALFPELLR